MRKLWLEVLRHEKGAIQSTIWRSKIRLQIVLPTEHFSSSHTLNRMFFKQSCFSNRNFLIQSRTLNRIFLMEHMFGFKIMQPSYLTPIFKKNVFQRMLMIFHALLKNNIKFNSLWGMIP